MKGKKTSDVAAYEKAVEFYKRYLAEEPNATDKAKVEKAIGVLEAEIKRLEGTPRRHRLRQRRGARRRRRKSRTSAT